MKKTLSILLAALLGQDVSVALGSLMLSLTNSYAAMLAMGAVALASEWKKVRAPGWRKIALLFTFPIFQMTYIPISCAALFRDVQWKPIEHPVAVSMREMNRRDSRSVTGRREIRTAD